MSEIIIIKGKKFFPYDYKNTHGVTHMAYCNSGMNYGLTKEGKFLLVDSPLMADKINYVLGTFDTFDEMRNEFLKVQYDRKI